MINVTALVFSIKGSILGCNIRRVKFMITKKPTHFDQFNQHANKINEISYIESMITII